MKRILRVWLGTMPAVCGFSEALPETFETGIPRHFTASRPAAVSVSDEHRKHGTRSLRWNWEAGDSLRVDHDLGDIRREGGYGGSYSKSTFGVWLYSPRSQPGEITFEFRTGENRGARNSGIRGSPSSTGTFRPAPTTSS